MNIDQYWLQFVEGVLLHYPEAYTSSTGRKYVENVGLSIPGEAWDKGMKLTVNDLGYRGKTSKMNQLKRNYYNQEAITAARNKLQTRVEGASDFTSVAIPTFAANKKSTSQGHCIVGLVVSYVPSQKRLGVTVFYRVTEVIQKFAADLIFLHDIVIPDIIPDNIPCGISTVNFRFTNAYFSPLFMPVLFPYVNPVQLLKTIEADESLPSSVYKSCYRAVVLPVKQADPEHYAYRTRKVMHSVALQAMERGLISREEILRYMQEKGDV